jgi:hypothetical protein
METNVPRLPTDAAERKGAPIATGVVDYFPDALFAVAICSRVGNDQHNPGQPLHWARGKSTDHADCVVRHLVDRGTVDSDGVRHSAKVAWRALAMLQTEIEEEREAAPDRNCVTDGSGECVAEGPCIHTCSSLCNGVCGMGYNCIGLRHASTHGWYYHCGCVLGTSHPVRCAKHGGVSDGHDVHDAHARDRWHDEGGPAHD